MDINNIHSNYEPRLYEYCISKKAVFLLLHYKN